MNKGPGPVTFRQKEYTNVEKMLIELSKALKPFVRVTLHTDSTNPNFEPFLVLEKMKDGDYQRMTTILETLGIKPKKISTAEGFTFRVTLPRDVDFNGFMSICNGIIRENDELALEKAINKPDNTLDDLIDILRQHDAQKKLMRKTDGTAIIIDHQIKAIEGLRAGSKQPSDPDARLTNRYNLKQIVTKLIKIENSPQGPQHEEEPEGPPGSGSQTPRPRKS